MMPKAPEKQVLSGQTLANLVFEGKMGTFLLDESISDVSVTNLKADKLLVSGQ